MENNIAEIKTVKINDGYNNKKIVMKFDMFNNLLIFEGYCKIKLNNITQWTLLTVEKINIVNINDKVNFEEITKKIHNKMLNKLNIYELIKGFMTEVTEIEIKDS